MIVLSPEATGSHAWSAEHSIHDALPLGKQHAADNTKKHTAVCTTDVSSTTACFRRLEAFIHASRVVPRFAVLLV